MEIPEEKIIPNHYSGRNRVPNIKEFVQRLDRDKSKRDAVIDAELDRQQDQEKDQEKQMKGHSSRHDAKDHEPAFSKSKHTRTVRDPVTGKDVQIEDVSTDFKSVVDNPMVSWPKQRDRGKGERGGTGC
jgi:chromatin remodeling complex protein RSC6